MNRHRTGIIDRPVAWRCSTDRLWYRNLEDLSRATQAYFRQREKRPRRDERVTHLGHVTVAAHEINNIAAQPFQGS